MNLFNPLILLLLATAVVSCGGGDNPPPKKNPYKIIDLGVGYAGDINELGYVTGVSDGQAYIYDGVTKNLIGTYGTGTVSPAGINSNGEVVATYRPSGSLYDTSVAYYDGTQWLWIEKFSSEFAWANDINDSGQIAGTYKPSGSGNRAFIYTSSSFTVIPNPDNVNYNHSHEINKDGYVSGTYKDASNIYRAYVFDGTNVTVIPSLAEPRIIQSYGYGLNDNADVVGQATDAGYIKKAFLYSLNSIETLNGIDPNSESLDINNKNIIVGTLNANITDDNRAFIYDGAKVSDLTELLNDSEWILRTAEHINDKGMIIGRGLINNELHGYLLIPQ